MAVKKVLRMGSPLLRRIAEPVVEFDTAMLWDIIGDMQDTMQAADGAGLAAPQIGINLRIVIFGGESNPRYPDRGPVPRTILINPEWEAVDPQQDEDWEGCLSVPGMRGWVPRYTNIVYRGFDPRGNPVDCTASEFHARVVQHECDHLDGILYPQKIRDMTRFGFIEELLGREE